MKHIILRIAPLLLATANTILASDKLEEKFINPPDSARPWVY